MAFLDNSGDIILDAVLTDHGRKTLAKGDQSFSITKFALGDEEVDYSLYNSGHASGSAYYDIEILQTPVLEAFTNNASSMKSKLVTIGNNNLLYMPILRLNTNLSNTKQHTSGSYMVAVDAETEGTDAAQTSKAVGYIGTDQVAGIMFGSSLQDNNVIRVDQGLDTNEISPTQRSVISDMIDETYIMQIDNRLGKIVSDQGSAVQEDYIDDDNIAYYTVDASDGIVAVNMDDTNSSTQVIRGPRGTKLEFKIEASLQLQTSTYLFTQLGGTTTMRNKAYTSGVNNQSVRYIDSIVRITGMTSGYSIDIPIRFIKTVTS